MEAPDGPEYAAALLGRLLGGRDVTDPHVRNYADTLCGITWGGRRLCWDTYDYTACAGLDRATAASVAAGARPAGEDIVASAVASLGYNRVRCGGARFERRDEAKAAAYAEELARQGRRRPSELVALVALHLRREQVPEWADLLRAVLGFVGRNALPDGRRVAILEARGVVGLTAVPSGHGTMLVGVERDGTMVCWQGCVRTMCIGFGRGSPTCFTGRSSLLHPTLRPSRDRACVLQVCAGAWWPGLATSRPSGGQWQTARIVRRTILVRSPVPARSRVDVAGSRGTRKATS